MSGATPAQTKLMKELLSQRAVEKRLAENYNYLINNHVQSIDSQIEEQLFNKRQQQLEAQQSIVKTYRGLPENPNQLQSVSPSPDAFYEKYRPATADLTPKTAPPGNGGASVEPGLNPHLTQPPSPAQPPPTLRTSTARTSQYMSEPLPTAAPVVATAEALAHNGGLAGIVDFGFRVVAGQPFDKAAFGAGGTAFGSVLGGGALSEFGPAGIFIGSTIGGSIGGSIADFIYDQTHPSKAEVLKESPKVAPPPFTGGQRRTIYTVSFSFNLSGNGKNSYHQGEYYVWGPIQGIRLNPEALEAGTASVELLCHGVFNGGYSEEAKWFEARYTTTGVKDNNQTVDSLHIINVVPSDGKPDDVNLPSTTFPPPDRRSFDSVNHPGNQEYSIPTALPKPLRVEAPNNYAIGGLKSRENGTPRGNSPNWVAHGYLANSIVSDNMPGLLMAPLPDVQLIASQEISKPLQKANPYAAPTPEIATQLVDQSYPRVNYKEYAPRGAEITHSTGYIGSWSGSFDSNISDPLSQAPNKQVHTLPETQRPNTKSDAYKSTTPGTYPTPSIPNKPVEPNPLTPDFAEMNRKVAELGIGLVALTQLVQGLQKHTSTIANNTSKEALETAAAAGTCRTTQPGGCMNKLVNDAANDAGDKAQKGVLNNIQNLFNALLAPVIALLQKIGSAVGVGIFPATVPASFIEAEGVATKTTVKNSIPELMVWQSQRIDEVIGQFELPVEIKDNNAPTGTPPKKIKFPNVSEILGEIFQLTLSSMLNSEMLINFATRIMVDGGQNKQQSYITYKLLHSLVDWAGFKYRDKIVPMPMMFSPGQNSLIDLLKETKVNVSVPEFDEKFGLEADLMRLRELHSIIKSDKFKQIDLNQNIKEQIMNRLRNSRNVARNVNGNTDERWEQFLKDVELGFTNNPGVTDPQHPYERDFANRPKINDITKRKQQ